ncbi:MAG: InlB B-repeat-containing protein [Paludibacteraceae bacterium]|nr:InlB B-repeat-containing protein [Paludibacteraceae bacterium]
MTSSTTRAFMAKKQSTSFAQVATNLLNVLQGYTKGIRFLLVIFLTLTVSANAWGADVTFATSAYNGKGGVSGTGGNATATIDGVTITSTKAYYTSAHIREYSGGTITVSSSSNITKIVFTSTASGTNSNGPGKISLNSGGGSYSYSGTEGTWTGTSSTVTFKCDAQFRWKQIVVTTAPAAKYKVTFNAGTNGTCSTPSLTEASAGAGVTLPNVTPNSGYSFLGWATTSAATTANAGKAGENYKPSSNITLYAIYVQQYTIQWYADGTLLEAKTYDKGSPIQAPTVSVTPCEGMQHVGWTTISDYTHATEAPSSFFDEDTPLGNATFNMKFYALFAKVEGPTETPTTLTETIKFTNFSSGTSTRTYESTSANWTWKKNDGSNIAEYDEIRLYAKHSMTIAPKTECSISKIVATCTSNSYATDLGGSSLTGATKTVSNSTVTISPTGGDIIITQAAQSRVSQFVVTFTASVSSGQKYSNYTTQCITKTTVCLIHENRYFYRLFF